jgi:hypothetical protein
MLLTLQGGTAAPFRAHAALCPLCLLFCREAAILEAHAATLSASTRQMLQAHSGAAALLRTTVEPHNPAHLQTSEGGLATMRLAQVLLAGYCARLPGNDRCALWWGPGEVGGGGGV